MARIKCKMNFFKQAVPGVAVYRLLVKSTFDEPGEQFSMIIYGKSGQGKTELCIMFMIPHPLWPRTLQQLWTGLQQEPQDAQKARSWWGKRPYTLYPQGALRRNGEPSEEEEKPLHCVYRFRSIQAGIRAMAGAAEPVPKKMFIMIAHVEGDEPKVAQRKAIEFDVDIKVLVKGYQAHPKSRFGGKMNRTPFGRKDFTAGCCGRTRQAPRHANSTATIVLARRKQKGGGMTAGRIFFLK